MKILLTADVHIGRQPSRVPLEHGQEFSCSNSWRAIVDLALAENVRALIVAGDLVDASNQFLEAAGALEEGVRRLGEQGVELILIAGNHDVEVMPELARVAALDSVRILGKNGCWESLTVTGDAHEICPQVFAWSFPHRENPGNPVASFPRGDVDPTRPCLGILHSDFGSPDSRYCGTSGTDYTGLPVDLWVIGHLHKPTLTQVNQTARILIPGSPQGMDPGPGEQGIHGVWILDTADSAMTPEFVPVGGLCYERVVLHVPEDCAPSEVPRLAREAIADKLGVLRGDHAQLKAAHVRLTVKGRSKMTGDEVETALSETLCEPFEIDGVLVFAHEYAVEVEPALDVTAMMEGKGVLAVLARVAAGRIEDDERAYLTTAFSTYQATVRGDRYFGEIDSDTDGPAESLDAAVLRRWAMRILEKVVGG